MVETTFSKANGKPQMILNEIIASQRRNEMEGYLE